ncbi:hypothetical protein HanIR_Chr14g0673581 [Helianthus annuus]|nr:hypothetical protein HanIR_Chr14g0673581 [Helianthus annuus]
MADCEGCVYFRRHCYRQCQFKSLLQMGVKRDVICNLKNRYCLPYVERTLRCLASFEDKSSFVHSFDEDVHNRMIHVLTGAVGAELVLKEKLADREKKCEDLQRQIQETKAAITEKRDANIKRKEAIQLAKDTVEELNRTMQTLNITQG